MTKVWVWVAVVTYALSGLMSEALIAYDCGHEKVTVTTLSLLDVDNCSYERDNATAEEVVIQLVQTAETDLVHVYQCKVEVLRGITHCGMHSHSSAVSGGLSSYIQEVSRDECMTMHRHGTYSFHGKMISNLARNGSTPFSMTIAGWANSAGSCSGAYYNSGMQEYKDVVVTASIQVTLVDYTTDTRKADKAVILKGGVVCPFSAMTCMDMTHGYTFWDSSHQGICEDTEYTVLYTGKVNVTTYTDRKTGLKIHMYSKKEGDIIFTVERKHQVDICHMRGYATEHPNLFIAPMEGSSRRFRSQRLTSKNMDMFTYINNKFGHLESHLREELSDLHYNGLENQCRLERELLTTQLSIAGINPPEFARLLMKAGGYTATQAGEVIHITKCQPVEVTLRKDMSCYQELPVVYSDQNYFMTPRSHLLTTKGTEIPCTTILPSMYLMMGQWYSVHNGVTDARIPHMLTPASSTKWTYRTPGAMGVAGLYPADDLQHLRQDIMYPSERLAVTNSLSRAAAGQEYQRQGINLHRMIDDTTVQAIMRLHVERIWGYFVNIGIIFQGLAGIFVVYKAIKFILDTTIHCHSLYTLFGWSWRLLAGFWDVMTYRMMARAKKAEEEADEATAPEQEFEVMITQPSTQSSLYPKVSNLGD